MTSIANAAPASQKQSIEYAAEVRFGVVLYGGVSLAIYINGVTNEIYEMVHATTKENENDEPAVAVPMTGAREVYRRLAWLANAANSGLRKDYRALIKARKQRYDGQPPRDVWDEKLLENLQPVRLVVDVISGTCTTTLALVSRPQ